MDSTICSKTGIFPSNQPRITNFEKKSPIRCSKLKERWYFPEKLRGSEEKKIKKLNENGTRLSLAINFNEEYCPLNANVDCKSTNRS